MEGWEKNGQGVVTSPDGYEYVGEFKDGKWEGQGTFTVSDGTKYVGEFKNGKNHGQGTLTFPDGIKLEGEFKEDEPWNTTGFDKMETFLERTGIEGKHNDSVKTTPTFPWNNPT